ncbi:MAG TPA: patatin-like phospholipase family protein, partial [Acidimicrobiales bacterium]|nr:patatin-like phospholipase family protein [Acidimicrobiales bacterium]
MPPDTRPELRLALAMRGGVSLAVWIGGAVAEIDLARRASPDVRDGAAPGQAFWKDLLALSGYRSVTVDVLAGASAGGLNGVLYAASQVYDFDYDAMRAVWLDVGDTQRLVRSRDSWFLPSMFRGDGFFAPQVEKALRERIPDRPDGERPPGPRVQLDLAATSLEPISRPVPSPSDEQLRDRRHASGFRFRNPEERWLTSSFHPRKAETRAPALWRLAVAARATSAF